MRQDELSINFAVRLATKSLNLFAVQLGPFLPVSNKPMKVLVVDDCAEHLAVMLELLADLGFETRGARNGELALSQVSEFAPQCILLDVNMPVMDGYDLAKTLRTYLLQEATLIGMSGGDPRDPVIEGVKSIVERWFQKPVDIDELADYLCAVPTEAR